jgi:hypothetical protein
MRSLLKLLRLNHWMLTTIRQELAETGRKLDRLAARLDAGFVCTSVYKSVACQITGSRQHQTALARHEFSDLLPP